MPDDGAPDAESVVGGEKSEFKKSEAIADEVVPHPYEGIIGDIRFSIKSER